MRAALYALFSAALLLGTGCGPYEEQHAILEIKTDFGCSELTDVDIDLQRSDGGWTTVASTAHCSDGRVGSLVFLPRDISDSDTTSDSGGGQVSPYFDVKVTAGVEVAASQCEANGFFGCIIARRRMQLVSRPVEILLTKECVNDPCLEGATTCVSGGECVPFTVDYDTCGEVCDESDIGKAEEGS